MLNNFRKIYYSSFIFFFLAFPASTSYKLKDFGFGSGGTAGSSSSTYSIEGITGEVSGEKSDGGSYDLGPGLIFTNQANVPIAPTFSNPSNYYNKLKLVINPSNNPDDTVFAVAISDDDFSTIRYVQSDDTVGSVLGAEDYRNYVDWNETDGILVIGLSPGTEYKVKAKAMQGKFTETGYGPEDNALTVNPTLSFNISTNSINFGDLVPDTVEDSPQNIVASFSTNGENGGKIYVSGSNEGLSSAAANHTINTVSDNLASISIPEGFGAQGVSATQTSGGPLTIATFYDKDNDVVGATDQTIRDIFNTAGPITGGSGTFLLKAKSSLVTPSANDYQETLTVIASGNF